MSSAELEAEARRQFDALELDGRLVADGTRRAVYLLGRQPMSAIACPACRFVTIVLGLPRHLWPAHACPRCRHVQRLRPPAEAATFAP